MTLNLIQAYQDKNPDVRIHYACAPGIGEALAPVMRLTGIERILTLAEFEEEKSRYRKVYSLVGYPLTEGYPEKPMRRHLLDYFAAEVGLSEPGCIRIPYVKIEPLTVTIHVQAGWSPYKNWPIERWEEICERLILAGFTPVQIGGPKDPRLQNAKKHLLGQSLWDNMRAIGRAQFHMGIDSWSNHATNIEWGHKGKTPAVILWGSTQFSAAGYGHNRNISLGLPCQPCFREDPKISQASRGICPNPSDQTYQNPKHECMARITVDRVWSEFLKLVNETVEVSDGET